ncbi:MAG: carbon-nitrogen family hydrolase [Thermodesulfobacteriota bacterium]
MKLALAQMDIVWHDREQNYRTARRLAVNAKKSGARALVLPEMFSTGFSMDTEVTAETLSGPTPSTLRSLASELELWVVGGFALAREDDAPQNVALAVTPAGRDTALYAKIHLIGLLDEDRHYGPGNVPVLFELDGVRTACFICYDLRFPELFRCIADYCDLVLVIASWPEPRQAHWEALLKARAIENQCYVAGVNRVGLGGGHEFAGGSVIVDPLGVVAAQAKTDETVITAEIDPERVAGVRKDLPFLNGRRPHIFQTASSVNPF